MVNQAVTILDFTLCKDQKTLIAFFAARLPSGMIIHNIALHQKDGQRWIHLPNREIRSSHNNAGIRYQPIISFVNDAGKRFTEQILRALEEQCSTSLRHAATENQKGDQ